MPDQRGGFNGSTQHEFAAHLAEFKRANPFAGVDSKKTPSWLGLAERRSKGHSFLKSTIGSTD
jgi:hypothetical protein